MGASRKTLASVGCLLVLGLFSCQAAPATPNGAEVETQSALTVEALINQVATPVLPVPTLPALPGTPAPSPSPSSPPGTQGTPTPEGPCNSASLIGDVNYFRGTVLPINYPFRKIWDVRNVGTCTWTPAYRLVFAGGKHMNGPNYVNFPQTVAPGGHLWLAVSLMTPDEAGSWTGAWNLEAPDGTKFGVATAIGVVPLIVNIVVPGTPSP